MKKIDLHIHTVQTPSDSKNFTFDLGVLKNYVIASKLDAIAVTNHNAFYRDNWEEISESVGVPVFPGAELNISTAAGFGHVLLIADQNDIEDFASGMKVFADECPGKKDHVEWERVIEIFPKLKDWLVIPHYKKTKKVDTPTLKKIEELTGCDALEVSNAKKWIVESGSQSIFLDAKSIVTFSDCRPGLRMPDANPSDDAMRYAYGFTYIQCVEMTVPAIKLALATPRNVSVFADNREFEILPESLPVSKRMNVVLGERSSGKTYTLKRIRDAFDDPDVLYIEQFEITNEAKEDKFNEDVAAEDATFFTEYFKGLQSAMDDYFNIDAASLESDVRSYCTAVVSYAKSPSDEYSNRPIYQAREYDLSQSEAESKVDAELRKASLVLANNTSRHSVIEEYLDVSKLQALNNRLQELMYASHVDRWQKTKCDEIVSAIKRELSKQSSRKPLPSAASLKDYFKYCYRQHRLAQVLDVLSKPKELESEEEYKYLRKRTRKMCASTNDAKAAYKKINRASVPRDIAVSGLFGAGITSAGRLQALREFNPDIQRGACSLLFLIESRIVLNNGSNASLSGGQRAEYLLIHKIASSVSKDVVLIDEPESSFDNPFLNSEVIRLLNDVAERSTVFLVTHNNTLGVSLKPDCVIYTEKDPENKYHIYSGSLTAHDLTDIYGNKRDRADTLLSTMEAGKEVYLDRRPYYGIA
jgi:PHP N-terminal domain-containing protein